MDEKNPIPELLAGTWSNETLCIQCGFRFGLHYGLECPNGIGTLFKPTPHEPVPDQSV